MLYLLAAVLAFAAGHAHAIWFIRPDIHELRKEIDRLKRIEDMPKSNGKNTNSQT